MTGGYYRNTKASAVTPGNKTVNKIIVRDI
jgi:hypothetical protein